jgi:hypothetical protein
MGRGPDSAAREVWKRRLREFERGDEPVAEFCDREGVSVTSFYRWRRVLACGAARAEPRGTGRETSMASAAPAAKSAAGGLRFLPVEIVPSVSPAAATKPDAPASSSSACVEVLLPGGVRVLVPCDAAAAIRTVVTALVGGAGEGSSC